MSYFGQKVRACLIHEADIEITMLKLFIRRAIENNCAVSYKNKIYLFPPERIGDPFVITRLSEPESAIEIPANRSPDATDRFVDAFVFETGASIDDVLFHKSSSVDTSAVRWYWIKTSHAPIFALISRDHSFKELLGNND